MADPIQEELRWERRARELLQRVALAAAESSTVGPAIQIALDAVCAATGWPIGHALIKRDEHTPLVSSGIWHLESAARFQRFREVSERASFEAGVGLPGRVLSSNKPLWIMDVMVDENFPRAREAGDLGVKAAFGFPVSTRGQVRAVLEFFTPESVEPDLPLLEVMAIAGAQLGRVIERQESELALRQSEAKFRSLAETANDAIISADQNGVIISWNRGAERIFGYREAEAVGHGLALVIPERFRRQHEQGMARVQAGGETHVIGRTVELMGLKKDGSEFPIELSIASWRLGGEAYYSGIIRDIADRRLGEERLRTVAAELAVSREKAIEANQAKSIFLANMSHELRTPLNAILGFVQLMERDDQLSEEQRENLSIISESGEHLLGLVNDVLSISKIEAGQSTLNADDFDLRMMMQSLRSMLEPRARNKGLAFELELDPATPAFVRGDESKLRQVLINLLGNAIKFTARGKVSLITRWRGGRAAFEVADTGPGIDPAQLERIFEPFVQAPDASRGHEGTGLGLVIARNLVRMMGGELSVASARGSGARFSFEIGLLESASGTRSSARARVMRLEAGQPELRVLVADNDDANRKLLARLLGSVGFVVREAANGQEALELWRSWRPGFVWMDMRMPVMDGYQATIAIRSEERAEGAPPTAIVALTASAFEHDRPSILAAGCNEIVAKPFREQTLFDLLERYLGARYQRQDRDQSEPPSSLPELNAERLLAVSGALLAGLKESLVKGDDIGALEVIERIGENDRSLSALLAERVRAFRVEELLELLESRPS